MPTVSLHTIHSSLGPLSLHLGGEFGDPGHPCKFFLWLAVKNRCWTADRLSKRGLPHPAACLLCDQAEENHPAYFSFLYFHLASLDKLELAAIAPGIEVKSLSKGGNTKKEQFAAQSVSSGKESTNTPYPLSCEAEETMEQTQEFRPVDSSRKGVDSFTSNSSMEPERNSYSMIPSYPHRGKEEISTRSGLNDRERGDLKSNQAGFNSKTQSLQESIDSQEEVKVTKVSPPRRKANRDEKSERQVNYMKKESGPEISRTVVKQQQQLKQQQLQRPSSTSASQVSSKQSEKEDMEINAILEEEALIAAHRKEIESTMEIVREEMNLLAEVDQPGSLIDNYVAQLSFLLSRKASGLVSLQARLARFQQRLKEQEILSRQKTLR